MLLLSVCRILNKLTPEKFDKLSLELLNVGIDNPVILKGVILLVSNNDHKQTPFVKRTFMFIWAFNSINQ